MDQEFKNILQRAAVTRRCRPCRTRALILRAKQLSDQQMGMTECITRTRWCTRSSGPNFFAHRNSVYVQRTFNVRPTCPRSAIVQYKVETNALDEVRQVCRDVRWQAQLGLHALHVRVMHHSPNLDETSQVHYRPGPRSTTCCEWHRRTPAVDVGTNYEVSGDISGARYSYYLLIK